MFSREIGLIGEDNFKKLQSSKVAVIGVGGVGGYVVEALVRAGIGKLKIVDGDKVEASNINRQIIATQKTLGMYKVEAFKDRILDINPNCIIEACPEFYTADNKIDFADFDFIVDCIDSVKDKIELILDAQNEAIPILSAMGAGSRIEGSDFEIIDIYKTANDGLAKKVRHELKKRGIKKLDVCCAKLAPIKQEGTVGSMSYVPALEGAKMASYVINKLISKKDF
ncbi:MAG: tRNA threonylcarbamoyladenosine dehydratase [Clostridiales bacterium]|nr:tRNA threonylcarbamoyladenosine dehydratase [Clostridiales bacterium]